MNIAIVGPGAIGSTLAWHLSRAGHDVTVVARGERLAWLEREQAIIRSDGESAAVTVTASLAPNIRWDLVLVTVLAPQLGPLLPTLKSSSAHKIMLLFNTFESLEPLRQAIGPERFHFGFPGGLFTLLVDGRIHSQVRPGTTVDDAEVARILSEAGIPTSIEQDMQSWLRSHAAMVAPFMAMSVVVEREARGVTWKEAVAYAKAFATGFRIVRAGGNPVLPRALGPLSRLPLFLLAAAFWALSRTQTLRDLGKLGEAEPRMLIDMMNQAQPSLAGPLRAIRP